MTNVLGDSDIQTNDTLCTYTEVEQSTAVVCEIQCDYLWAKIHLAVEKTLSNIAGHAYI